MTAIDRFLNPARLALPIGNLRLNPVGLLMFGAVFYLAALRGWPTILITFAVIAVLYGWPLYELTRARGGKYSWMYPQIALDQVKEALVQSRLGLDEPESEVVSYLAARPSQLDNQHAIELLLQYDRPPFLTSLGQEERQQALERLVARGLVKRNKGCPEVVSLNVKSLLALV